MAVVYHRGSPSDRPSGTRRPTPGRLTACPREATLGKAPLPALRRRRRLRLCSRRPATGTVPPPHRWTAAREVEGLDIDAYRFCVIGPGRLGSTLLAGLQKAGEQRRPEASRAYHAEAIRIDVQAFDLSGCSPPMRGGTVPVAGLREHRRCLRLRRKAGSGTLPRVAPRRRAVNRPCVGRRVPDGRSDRLPRWYTTAMRD